MTSFMEFMPCFLKKAGWAPAEADSQKKRDGWSFAEKLIYSVQVESTEATIKATKQASSPGPSKRQAKQKSKRKSQQISHL